jgi:hypothetical protein
MSIDPYSEGIGGHNLAQPQRRLKTKRTFFAVDNDPSSVGEESMIEISPAGDVVTNDLSQVTVVNGDVISSAQQIVGQCQMPECSQFLTQRTVRYCTVCAMVLCPRCCNVDAEVGMLCPECRKAAWWQRFWAGFFSLLTWPFRRILR